MRRAPSPSGLETLFDTGVLTPEGVLAVPDETLRSLGLSRQKQASLKDLAARTLDDSLQLAALSTLSDEDVTRQLTQVRGIGVWTAEMFLIFSLGRLDVFPVGDLGIRKAIQRVYGYKKDARRGPPCTAVPASGCPIARLPSGTCGKATTACRQPPLDPPG